MDALRKENNNFYNFRLRTCIKEFFNIKIKSTFFAFSQIVFKNSLHENCCAAAACRNGNDQSTWFVKT